MTTYDNSYYILPAKTNWDVSQVLSRTAGQCCERIMRFVYSAFKSQDKMVIYQSKMAH